MTNLIARQVARLVIHDNDLNYLKDMFGKDGKKPTDMLIDPSDAPKKGQESGGDSKMGAGGEQEDRSASRGRGGWSREDDEDEDDEGEL